MQHEHGAAPSVCAVVRENYAQLLFLIALNWVATFTNFRQFGLYEDDWYYAVGAYLWDGPSWFRSLFYHMTHMTTGRPLQFAFEYINGYIGAAFSSIALLYILSFCYSAVVLILMYTTLSCRFTPFFCLLATTLFILSPVTTLRQFLNAAFTFSPSYILLFVAVLLFMRRWYWLCYPVAAGLFLTYESLFVLFLGAPLLTTEGRLLSRRMARHLATCVGIVLCLALLRMAVGEARMVSATQEPAALVMRVAGYALYNALNIGVIYIHALWAGVRELSLDAVLYAVAFAVALWFGATRPSMRAAIKAVQAFPNRSDRVRSVLRDANVGMAFIVLGLAPSYFVLHARPLHFLTVGRSTRVFASAEFGVNIAVAALCVGVLSWSSAALYQRAVKLLGGALLVGLLLYAFVVQHDYVAAWEKERDLIAQIMVLTPDVQPNTTIFVKLNYGDPRPFAPINRERAIGNETAMFAGVFNAILGGQAKPKVFFIFSDDWKQYLKQGTDGTLQWTTTEVPHRWDLANPPITPGRVIYLDGTGNSRLRRLEQPITVAGVDLLQPRLNWTSNWSRFSTTPLFEHVVPNVIPRGTQQ